MKEEEAQRLRDENDDLKRQVRELSDKLARFSLPIDSTPAVTLSARQSVIQPPIKSDDYLPTVGPLNGDSEAIYQFVKDRLSKEAPALLRVLTIVPELEIKVERKTLEVDGSTPKGRIARLFARGWFDEPKTQGGTRAELRRTGTDVNSGTVSTVFSGLLKDGFLTVESGDTYKAVPEMKVRIVEV